MQIAWAKSAAWFLFLLISCCTIPFVLKAGSVSGSAPDLQKTTVVEIASFYCPHCYKAQRYTPMLINKLKHTGGNYDFVPIFLNDQGKWPSLAYFGLLDGRNSLRNALFEAAQIGKLPMRTPKATCIALSSYMGNHFNVNRCIHLAKSPVAKSRLANAIRLLKHIYSDPKQKITLPIFVIERGGHIIDTLSFSDNTDMGSLINEVMSYVN